MIKNVDKDDDAAVRLFAYLLQLFTDLRRLVKLRWQPIRLFRRWISTMISFIRQNLLETIY